MKSNKITNVLISVFCKEGLEPLLKALFNSNVQFITTGGTQQFIEQLGYPVKPVEEITNYPSVFGGRVKTLHPSIFGGILFRRSNQEDVAHARDRAITPIDMVIIDLYPVEETIEENKTRGEVIEKIDIGGVSLIRAAAKNYYDVLTVSSRNQYPEILNLITSQKNSSTIADRERFAALAFEVVAHYDKAIANYFSGKKNPDIFNADLPQSIPLRYGENPHQKGMYYGNLSALFDQLNGKELSYNNLVDIDTAIRLVSEFEGETIFVIIKHTNACGVAQGLSVKEAYKKAFWADSLSAFGGVLATTKEVDYGAAQEINELFFDTLIAPSYAPDALALLTSKKNRKILQQKGGLKSKTEAKTLLDGIVEQDIDRITEGEDNLKLVTKRHPSKQEVKSLLFANKIVKHTKSNAIVLAVEGQMIAGGAGQTSRVDALKQAIEKAKRFNFNLTESVMASDAFFPFVDCVKIAHGEGIKVIIQPGGSIKDQESINFCDDNDMTMLTTGFRHFKH